MTADPRRARWALVAIVGLALALRVVVVLASPDFRPQTDAADYDRIAVSLADTGRFPNSELVPVPGPTAFRPPGFPLALAGTYALTGTSSPRDRWEAGRLMEALLGTLAVLLVALIALRLWGWPLALAAGGLAAVFPPLLLAGSSLMSESLFIPLTLAAVLAALEARERPHRLAGAVLAGLLTGAAALTRTNGLVLLLPICLLVWPVPRRARRSLAVPAAVIAAAVVMLVPWAIRNLHVFGQVVPVSTETGYAIAGTYNSVAQFDRAAPAMWVPPVLDMARILRAHPTLNEAQLSDRLVSSGADYVRAHPAAIPRTLFWSGLRLFDLAGPHLEDIAARYEAYPRFLTAISVYASWLLLAVVALALAAGGLRRGPAALWICPAVLLVSVLPWSGLTRYRVPADPFLLLLVVAGLAALGVRRPAGRRRGLALPSAPA